MNGDYDFTLKGARANADLSLKDAAKKIGVTPATLRNWERGNSYPDVTKIKKIEEVYGIPYNKIKFRPRITV